MIAHNPDDCTICDEAKERLSATQESVVKALEGFCVWIESQPAGSTSAETEYEAAGAALKELKEAQNG